MADAKMTVYLVTARERDALRAELERLRAIETAAVELVESWVDDGCGYPSDGRERRLYDAVAVGGFRGELPR